MLPVAAAVLVVGGLALFGVFGGDDGSEEDEAVSEQARTEIESARASLTESLEDRDQGIAARYPPSWESSSPGGERLLESRDRCMAIKLSAPASAGQAGKLRRDTIAAVRRDFKNAQVAPGEQGKQIGGIPTTQDVVMVQSPQGGQARVLVAVGTGKELAYLTEFVLRDPSCGQTLLEGQLILGSIRYTR